MNGHSEGYKRAFDQNWGRSLLDSNHALATTNIGIFVPFRPMPDQKTMQTRCLGDFFRYAGT